MNDPRSVAERHLDAVRRSDPVAMADDYHDDAVLVRGTERHQGRDHIAIYFATVPERLAGGRVEVEVESVEGPSVSICWMIRGGPADGTRGHDLLTITGGAISHQVVHLDDHDF